MQLELKSQLNDKTVTPQRFPKTKTLISSMKLLRSAPPRRILLRWMHLKRQRTRLPWTLQELLPEHLSQASKVQEPVLLLRQKDPTAEGPGPPDTPLAGHRCIWC
ncbi:hypothetical protein OIU74_002189 [Salix koriyanagi]|uniref:Uncharacterized protein n=1 Tax=Salix koriyanagi TaxID=2511006 RepID=A0A9Q0X430_9ROSI|nr:hypothetical protein OIU74_002189 [Salix koriyanagi]